MGETIDAVAIAICEACGDRPSHVGDAGGNAFRWQDYRPIAEKAIAAMDAAKDAEIAELKRRLGFSRENEVAADASMEQACAEMLEWKARADSAEESLRIMTSSANIWKRESEVSAGERDEARECVGRLYRALQSVGQSLAWHNFGELRSFDHFGSSGSPPLALNVADNIAKSELAATPEHLR